MLLDNVGAPIPGTATRIAMTDRRMYSPSRPLSKGPQNAGQGLTGRSGCPDMPPRMVCPRREDTFSG